MIGRKCTVDCRNQRLGRHLAVDNTIIMSSTLKVTGNHVMYNRSAWFLRVVMSSARALCCLYSNSVYTQDANSFCKSHRYHQHLCYRHIALIAQFYILTVYLLNEWEGHTRKKHRSQLLSTKRLRPDATKPERHDRKQQEQVCFDPTQWGRILSSDRGLSSFLILTFI